LPSPFEFAVDQCGLKTSNWLMLILAVIILKKRGLEIQTQ